MRFRGFLNLFAMIYLLAQMSAAQASNAGTLLLRQPSLSKDHIAFVYGGHIWVSDRGGAHATRITAVIIPIPDEGALRQWTWVEGNRDYVERKTGGKVAYVYLPDTAGEGYTFFNRMFFASVDQSALIVDD